MRVLAVLALGLLGSCGIQRTYVVPDHALPFSEAVRVGDTLYVSGHLGLDAETGQAPADPEEEARLLMQAFERTLGRAGSGIDQVVSVTVFCSDVTLYETFNAVYTETFAAPYPARAFVGSGTLLRGCRFEMMGVADLR